MTTKKLSKKQLLNKSKKRFVKKSRSIKRKLRKLTKLKGGASASASASARYETYDTILLPYEITHDFFIRLNLTPKQNSILTNLKETTEIEDMPYNPEYFAETLELTPTQRKTYYIELDNQKIPRPILSGETNGIIHPSKLIPTILDFYFVEGKLKLTRMQLKALKILENDIKKDKLTNKEIITGLNFSDEQIEIYKSILKKERDRLEKEAKEVREAREAREAREERLSIEARQERLASLARFAEMKNNGTNPYVPFGLLMKSQTPAPASRELPPPLLPRRASLAPRESRAPLPPRRASQAPQALLTSQASRASENTIPPKHWNPFVQSEPIQKQELASESPYHTFGINSNTHTNSNTLLNQFVKKDKDKKKEEKEKIFLIKYFESIQGIITYDNIKLLIPPDFAKIYIENSPYTNELLQALNERFNKTEPVYAIPTSLMSDFPIKINPEKFENLKILYNKKKKLNDEDIKRILNTMLITTPDNTLDNKPSFLLNNEVKHFYVNNKGKINTNKDAVKALVANINEWFKKEQERDSNA